MSFKLDTQHLDCGDVADHDAGEKNAVGGAMAGVLRHGRRDRRAQQCPQDGRFRCSGLELSGAGFAPTLHPHAAMSGLCRSPRCRGTYGLLSGWPVGYQREDAVFDSNDLSSAMERMTLTPSQAGIALGLQQYYQFVCVGPTPERLRMLLVELNKRAQAGSAS